MCLHNKNTFPLVQKPGLNVVSFIYFPKYLLLQRFERLDRDYNSPPSRLLVFSGHTDSGLEHFNYTLFPAASEDLEKPRPRVTYVPRGFHVYLEMHMQSSKEDREGDVAFLIPIIVASDYAYNQFIPLAMVVSSSNCRIIIYKYYMYAFCSVLWQYLKKKCTRKM